MQGNCTSASLALGVFGSRCYNKTDLEIWNHIRAGLIPRYSWIYQGAQSKRPCVSTAFPSWLPPYTLYHLCFISDGARCMSCFLIYNSFKSSSKRNPEFSDGFVLSESDELFEWVARDSSICEQAKMARQGDEITTKFIWKRFPKKFLIQKNSNSVRGLHYLKLPSYAAAKSYSGCPHLIWALTTLDFKETIQLTTWQGRHWIRIDYVVIYVYILFIFWAAVNDWP